MHKRLGRGVRTVLAVGAVVMGRSREAEAHAVPRLPVSLGLDSAIDVASGCGLLGGSLTMGLGAERDAIVTRARFMGTLGGGPSAFRANAFLGYRRYFPSPSWVDAQLYASAWVGSAFVVRGDVPTQVGVSASVDVGLAFRNDWMLSVWTDVSSLGHVPLGIQLGFGMP